MKVKKSEDFKKFAIEDPRAYLCSMFFMRDFDGKQNDSQIDFYSPKIKKIISFKVLGDKVERSPVDKKAATLTQKKFIPKQIEEKVKIDLDVIKELILDEMHNRGITDSIKKIIAVIQNIEGKTVWNCTCFLSGLNILFSHVEDSSKTILYMDRKSFFDMIIPVKKGESLEDAMKKRKEQGSMKDCEKMDGNNSGFIR